jgi:co-chaperonin GroES (HSP10)
MKTMSDIKSLKAAGTKLIVEIEEEKKTSEGGIIFADNDVRREQDKRYVGTLVKTGDIAFYDMVSSPDRLSEGYAPRIGDKIYFVKFSGIELERGGKYYRIMEDENVYAYEEQ